LEHAGDEQPPDATTPPLAGDETSWKRGSLNGRTEAEEDPPQEEENVAASTTAEQGGASLLAEDSGGDTTPSLRNRQRENRLRNLPKLSSNLKMHHAAELLSPTTTAGQERAQRSWRRPQQRLSRGPITEANSAVFHLGRTAERASLTTDWHRTTAPNRRRTPAIHWQPLASAFVACNPRVMLILVETS
jgi:hypothetical protein